MKETLTVDPEHHGIALDRFLGLRFPKVPRAQLRGLLRRGAVRVDGVVRNGGRTLRRFALVEIDGGEEEWREREEEAPTFEVLRENPSVLFVSKPPGIAVSAERWAKEAPHLLGMLRRRYGAEEVGAPLRPRLAHRLDRDTSGVLAVALTTEAERELRTQFEDREAEKTYLALVDGEVPGEEGSVDLPIGEDPRRPGRMQTDPKEGKEAFTAYRVEERFRGFTWLRVRPRTGRTHQVRVHLAARGFPLAVDPFYGRRKALFLSEIKPGYRRRSGGVEKPLLARTALHALSLAVRVAGERVEVEAPLPEDLSRTLRALRRYRPSGGDRFRRRP